MLASSKKKLSFSSILFWYWLISPCLFFLSLYFVRLKHQQSLALLLAQPFIATSFLTACLAFLQSYLLKAAPVKERRRYFWFSLFQQVATFNLLGAFLVFFCLREKNAPTATANVKPWLWWLGVAFVLLLSLLTLWLRLRLLA